MEWKALTFAERNVYSGANGLMLLVVVMAVTTLAATSNNVAVVMVVAALAGSLLAGWSRLIYDLVEAADRWIGPLVYLAALICLLAALAESWQTLASAAMLLFVCWLPYMVAESTWQALQVRVYLSQAAYAWRLSLAAQSAIDVAAIGATAVLLATGSGGDRLAARLTAALIMAGPLLLARTTSRFRQPVRHER